MTGALAFDAVLWRPDTRGGSCLITLPFDAKALFGRARCPVRVTINGHSWRTTTQVYGDGFTIVVNAEARAAASIEPGATVHVQLRKDDTVKATDLPVELAARLRLDHAAKEAFELLPASHRREYARWVADAKLPQTRVRRSEASAERLKAGVSRPQSA